MARSLFAVLRLFGHTGRACNLLCPWQSGVLQRRLPKVSISKANRYIFHHVRTLIAEKHAHPWSFIPARESLANYSNPAINPICVCSLFPAMPLPAEAVRHVVRNAAAKSNRPTGSDAPKILSFTWPASLAIHVTGNCPPGRSLQC